MYRYTNVQIYMQMIAQELDVWVLMGMDVLHVAWHNLFPARFFERSYILRVQTLCAELIKYTEIAQSIHARRVEIFK